MRGFGIYCHRELNHRIDLWLMVRNGRLLIHEHSSI